MNNSVMMATGYGTGLLNTSFTLENQDMATMASSSSYCTLAASHIPIYAALQAANDSPPHDTDSGLAYVSHHLNHTEGLAAYSSHVQHESADRIKSPYSSVYQHSSSNDGDIETRGDVKGEEDLLEEDREDISYNDNVSKWLHQQCSGGHAKRKRKVSRVQRLAANQRERRRMGTFNEAFENLRRTIYHENECNKRRKMSRIQTLKSAIQYITDLQEMLNEADNKHDDTEDIADHTEASTRRW